MDAPHPFAWVVWFFWAAVVVVFAWVIWRRRSDHIVTLQDKDERPKS